ncbi:type IV secretory system conjugative DNA transfer family protein [Pseudochrobactrum sp. MP213Fo]|uniref:type IV secretory system conjugative DNA transfer family protein n=1 Tax=Pseudochrobactrum sp. MP213Fo TaxID=3022250 RepID=UPI003BA0EFFB
MKFLIRAGHGLLWGLIAYILWTLGYGILLFSFYGEEKILHTIVTSNPFIPLLQLWYYSQNLILLQISAGALIITGLIISVAAYIIYRPRKNLFGDASFQDMKTLRKGKWFRKEGHVFGRINDNILRCKDDRHHLIIGPTRSGKGAGYVIPNALMHKGSMVVTDLKGEIFAATAGFRRKNGNQVFLFSPGAENTNRYNPLDFIRQGRGNRTTDIQNIATILVPENEGSENAVWQATAQQLMAGVISYILESAFYKNRRNLGEVNSFFNAGVDLQAMMKFIISREPELSKFTVESFNSYTALADRSAASALLDIQKALRPFKNERIVSATNTTDIDLRAMKRRPISVYLAPNITDITLLRPLLVLFLQQLMDILTLEHDPHSVPVYFLLDEFRQLQKMNEIMTKLPYVAGYNIKLAFIIQDLKNLDEIYGETARHSLLGNCGYQLILGANDQETAEYASRSLGKRTIYYKTETVTLELFGFNKRTKVEQVREVDLMLPQEVRQLNEKKMILFVEGQRPIFADKIRFFEMEPFKSAEMFSRTNKPIIPAVDYPAPQPVPVLTEQYSVTTAPPDSPPTESG